MTQIYGHSWNIVSKDGHILQKSIRLNSYSEAEDYVRRYISSYQDWTYEMRPKNEKT